MNITELPPELLIHILSFVSQRDLLLRVHCVSKYLNEICNSSSLWTSIKYNITYLHIREPLDHFYQVQHFIKRLIIKAENLSDVFEYHRKIRLPNVKRLNILENVSNNMWKHFISGEFADMFPGLENLTFTLSLHLSMIVCLHVLKEFNLTALSIGHNAFTSIDDALISFLKTQSKLKQLYLNGVMCVSDGTIANIINEYPNITMIRLSRQKISNKVFTSSTTQLSLTKFKVNSDKLDDEGFECLLQRSPCLISLNIEHCSKITNLGLQHLITYGGQLQDLCIGFYDEVRTTHLSNQTLQIIAFSCHKLRHLTAIGCSDIDCTGISALVKSCKDLKTLVMRNCGNITDGMLLLIRSCISLKKISLYGKVDVSLNNVISVLQSCKHIDEFSLTGIQSYPYNLKNSCENLEPKDLSDVEILDDDVKNFHSRVKLLVITCSRDITKDNVSRLTKLCPDLRTLVIDFHYPTGLDSTFTSELFHNCGFLSKVSLRGKTFHRLQFVQTNRM